MWPPPIGALVTSVFTFKRGSRTAYSGTGDDNGDVYSELDADFEELELLSDLPFLVLLERIKTSCGSLELLIGMRVTVRPLERCRGPVRFFFSFTALLPLSEQSEWLALPHLEHELSCS